MSRSELTFQFMGIFLHTIALAVLGFVSCTLPRDNSWDQKRCSPACPGGQMCFEGTCQAINPDGRPGDQPQIKDTHIDRAADETDKREVRPADNNIIDVAINDVSFHDINFPDFNKLDAPETDVSGTDTSKSDVTKLDVTNQDSATLDIIMPDATKPDVANLDIFSFDGGDIACDIKCNFDTTQCYQCGDGIINGNEECDSSTFNGETCFSEGFVEGALQCSNECKVDTSKCIKWYAFTTNVQASLGGIWGTSDNDIFVVGEQGTILHYDGNQWNKHSSGTSVSINDIWGISAQSVHAVGFYDISIAPYKSTLLKYDGNSWSKLTVSNLVNLTSAKGLSANDIWAVGEGGGLFHYNGSSWKYSFVGEVCWLRGVYMAESNQVWVVGDSGFDPRIFYYNGTNWQTQNSPATYVLFDIWGTSATNIYAVGGLGTYHWDGNQWSAISATNVNGRAIFGNGPDNIYIASSGGEVFHYNGVEWKTEATGTSETYYGIWVSPTGKVYAVGTNGSVIVRK